MIVMVQMVMQTVPLCFPHCPHRLCRPSLCPFASVLLPHDEYMSTAIFAARLQKRSKFLALLGNFLYIFYLKLPQAAMSLGWCWRQTRSVDFSPVRERKFEWFDSTFAATQSFFLVLSRSSSREPALSPRFRRENDCLPAKNSHFIAITRESARCLPRPAFSIAIGIGMALPAPTHT